MKRTGIIGLGLTLLLAIGTNVAASDQRPPMVIAVSWSSPEPRYLSQHIETLEKRPFTGTMINVSGPSAPEAGSVELGAAKDNLSWTAFARGNRFDPETIQRHTEDLRQTRFTRCRDNFLWVVSYYLHKQEGGYFDWFDDARWADVLYNIECLARLAKDGGLRGLGLDFEEYGSPIWSYGAEKTRPGFALKHL